MKSFFKKIKERFKKFIKEHIIDEAPDDITI